MNEVALPDGGRLSIATAGDGPPLLLLRPLGGSLVSWGPFADALARRVRVVMFDPRGAGCSSAAPIPTSTRAMAADAVAVLDALGIARAAVYGISLGGMVASWLALDFPERVAKLVLASTPSRGRAVHLGGWRNAVGLAACMFRRARAAEACLATRVLSSRYVAAHPVEVERIRALAAVRPASHRGLLTLLGAALTHDVDGKLSAVRADTLVVAGGADGLLPVSEQRRFAGRLANARCVVLSETGHDVSAEAPDVVAALVADHSLQA